jgi:hypothetical protein
MEAERFQELAEDAGYHVRKYSGRSMYGRQCVGIELDRGQSEAEMAAKIMLEAHNDDERELEDLVDLFGGTRGDSMGRGSIVYWPELEWADGMAERCEECERAHGPGYSGPCPH